MPISSGEKIKIVLKRKGLTASNLADLLCVSRQNLTNKFKRDNFNEKELREIANLLDCDFENTFTMRDTGEKI
nr:helix-turn-helix transcriptional regulator [uncultured Acetobacterium sp.]